MSPRVLLTGASGRLGRAVADRLHQEGYEFLATDIVEAGSVPYLFRPTDLLDHGAVSDMLEGIDVVMHIGNHPGIGATAPQVVFNQNTAMNANVFQAAAERGVGRIIFASTLQLIGSHLDSRTVVNQPPVPQFPLDGDTPAQPTNLYSLSKSVAEQMLRYYADRCGIDCVALRLPMLHNCDEWARARPGEETSTDVLEGFTGLTFGDASALFLAVLRADLSGYRSYMAGSANRHPEFDVAALVQRFYPYLPSDLPDLIDNSSLTLETGWEISEGFPHFTSKEDTQ